MRRLASLLLLCLAPACHALFPYTGGNGAPDRPSLEGARRETGAADAAQDRGRSDGTLDGKRPDAAKPDGKRPDAAKPDVRKPDAAKTDARKPDAAKTDVRKLDAAKPDVKKPDAPKPDVKKPDAIKTPDMGACGVWSAWTCTTSTTVCQGACICRAKCGAMYPLMICNQNSAGSLAQCTIQYTAGGIAKLCPDFAMTATGCPICQTAFNLCYP